LETYENKLTTQQYQKRNQITNFGSDAIVAELDRKSGGANTKE
jgi:hypothetical protein